jgi:hypothetical protein
MVLYQRAASTRRQVAPRPAPPWPRTPERGDVPDQLPYSVAEVLEPQPGLVARHDLPTPRALRVWQPPPDRRFDTLFLLRPPATGSGLQPPVTVSFRDRG